MAVTDLTTTAAGLPSRERERRKPAGQWALAWRRLRRHHLAMFGLFTLLAILTLSLLAPAIAPYEYDEQDYRSIYAPWFTPGRDGLPMHWLGTDGLGRDTLTRVLYAGRISLLVALSITLINIVVGTLLGSVSGFFGGRADSLLMRFTDLMLTLPDLPLLLILSASLRQFAALQKSLGPGLSVFIIIFVLSIFGWMTNARLVRASVLSLREQEFILASRSMGAKNRRIIFRHLIPNSLAPIIVSATLGFGAVIIAESALSFLGFGVMPPVPTWGNMLNEARAAPQIGYTLFYQTLAPGLCIFLTVLAINFIGDGLRDALDPRLKL
jgi:peptide/nickel transport system permease protein